MVGRDSFLPFNILKGRSKTYWLTVRVRHTTIAIISRYPAHHLPLYSHYYSEKRVEWHMVMSCNGHSQSEHNVSQRIYSAFSCENWTRSLLTCQISVFKTC